MRLPFLHSESDLLRIAAFNPYIGPGQLYLLWEPVGGFSLWARHPADLTPARMGTRWHVDAFRCPTWDPVHECRCMVEGC